MSLAVMYISNGNLPAHFAHTVQIMKMAAGFAEHARVTLVTAHRVLSRSAAGELHAWYDAPRSFTIVSLPVAGRERTRNRAGLAYAVAATIFARLRRVDLVVTRDSRIGVLCARAGLDTVIETSADPKTRTIRMLVRHGAHPRIRRVVTVTEHLRDQYLRAGVPAGKLSVLRNASEPTPAGALPDPVEVRRTLHLPIDQPIAIYVGNLYKDKGADVFVSASRELPGVQFVVVGETAGAADLVALGAETNVRFAGFVPHREVKSYLHAADVLVLPNRQEQFAAAAAATCPLKLFEYMEAERPIVATNITAVTNHVSHGKECHLVPADSPAAMAGGIRWVLDHPTEARRLAHAAKRAVAGYTWSHRAARILSAIDRLPAPERSHA